MSQEIFYITTAIDYTNNAPHIGHAYEKLLADVIARYQRGCGREVFFLTGVDQHGQKVQQSAAKEGLDPAVFAARNTTKFIALWEAMNIRYDGWAATTDDHHKAVVQKILQNLHDMGQLYKASHQGFYSIRQEQFLTPKERDEEGNFGAHWGEVIEYEEENWYFRLSEHSAWLKGFIETHPEFIYPSFRAKELANALDSSESSDLCISRPKSRLSWGIPIPFDPEFVTYVWFDALINYISFAGYLAEEVDTSYDGPPFSKVWPANAHLIGKDIMVPSHAIYWPIMLHALGFADDDIPPLVVHGFWNDKRGEKISKSEGNIIDPHSRLQRFGVDGLRYYLMASIATGRDADFNDERIEEVYEKDLANDLGNLLNRSLNMIQRYRQGALKIDVSYDDELNGGLRTAFETLSSAVAKSMREFQVSSALEEIWKRITLCNQFVEHSAPWKLAKDEESAARLDTVLYHLAEGLTHVALQLAPVMPETSDRMLLQLAYQPEPTLRLDSLTWGLLSTGHCVGKGEPLFPRLEALESASP